MMDDDIAKVRIQLGKKMKIKDAIEEIQELCHNALDGDDREALANDICRLIKIVMNG